MHKKVRTLGIPIQTNEPNNQLSENTLFLRISECAYDKLLVFEMQGLTPLNQIRL